MDKIEIPIGTDRSFRLDLKTENQEASPAFSLADTPLASVWSGRNLAPSFSPTATWIDPAVPAILVTFAAADTAGMPPGSFYLRVWVETEDGLRIPAPDALVSLTGSPGTDQPQPTDITLDDLLQYVPWLGNAPSVEDESGWLSYRSAASRWARRIFLMWYADWFQRGRRYEGFSRTLPNVPDLAALLTDHLVVDDRLREIESRYTASLICDGTIGSVKDNPYHGEGACQLNAARRLISGYRARVTTDDVDLDIAADRVHDILTTSHWSW